MKEVKDVTLNGNPKEGLLSLREGPGTKTKLGQGHRVNYGTEDLGLRIKVKWEQEKVVQRRGSNPGEPVGSQGWSTAAKLSQFGIRRGENILGWIQIS